MGRPRLRVFFAALTLFCATVAAAAATLQERLEPCLACHGETGTSQTPEVPSLGASPAPYVVIQLYLFREKQRRVEIMNDMAKGLSDDDLRQLADFIARLPAPKPPDDAADATRLERGRMLAQRHRCGICHLPNFAGRENIPRLAGQREDYLTKAMREYKNNTRPGYDASMGDVLAPVSDAEIVELSYFLARQR